LAFFSFLLFFKKGLEVNTMDASTHSEILDLKETINDWINYQKHISSLNTLQTPVTLEPSNISNSNTNLSDPYKG